MRAAEPFRETEQREELNKNPRDIPDGETY
jgi:hypothetical protein